MNGDSGFFYLNQASEWPGFTLSQTVQREDGALTLGKSDEEMYFARGLFAAEPLAAPTGETELWHRLRVSADPLPTGGHIQLFTLTTTIDEDGFRPDLTDDDPFPESAGWQAGPRDVLDILVLNPPARYLWIGGILWSDGQASPTLYQMRVDYGRETYLAFLPAIYGRDEQRHDFLKRFLSLPESVLGGLEETIADRLPGLFDPFAAPNGHYLSWLSWLASWLAFDLNEAWSEAETRRFLAQAFDLYGRRGTIAGLRRYLKLYAGVEAHIVEPGLHTSLWSLGEVSTLGFTTMLAPAHAQGAVVGTTATLDQSHMTQGEEFGAVLFEDWAHHFCVRVYCAELTRPGALDDARTVIEREKPAHTTYHLCSIEPHLRVGVQAQVGIDAIVAAGPPPAQIGMMLNTGVLAEEAEACEDVTKVVSMALETCPDEEVSDDNEE